jgi:hypothetical protein
MQQREHIAVERNVRIVCIHAFHSGGVATSFSYASTLSAGIGLILFTLIAFASTRCRKSLATR